MWKENLYQPVEVLVRSRDVFIYKEHQHSFFEVVYIKSGTGSFYTKEGDIGKNEVQYQTNSLFLIPPDLIHCFTIFTRTEFVFIRFQSSYVRDYVDKHIEQAFLNPNWQIDINLETEDAQNVYTLCDLILQEEKRNKSYTNYLLQQWINSVLVILGRNILQQSIPEHPEPTKSSYLFIAIHPTTYSRTGMPETGILKQAISFISELHRRLL